MKLRGKHALKVETVEDALGKLGTGSLTPGQFKDMQRILTRATPAAAATQGQLPPPVLPISDADTSKP
jgi:hypothetical protein